MNDRYDMHVHTNASDGTLTPKEVIDMAVKAGLKGIAITDHDTIAGLAPAQAYLNDNPKLLELIPGIELNTELENEEIHILGYFINPANTLLNERLQAIHEARQARIEKMVLLLQHAGLTISLEEVISLAQGESIGRPHVARALIAHGYVKSIKEAFAQYIGRGKVGYVPRYKFTPSEAINLIKSAGGIAVLAHPGLIRDMRIIKDIIKMGIEGLEVYYPEHNLEQEKFFAAMCNEYKIIQTGGSDYHGPGSEESRGNIGYSTISHAMLGQIYSYLQHKKLVFSP